jgi:nucleotide-binding universal stress UspA family protein
MAGRLRRAGLAAEGRAVVGWPADAIVATADGVGADLIVKSTHARTGPARAVLGSVADPVNLMPSSLLNSPWSTTIWTI